jgi:hypothetical protein
MAPTRRLRATAALAAALGAACVEERPIVVNGRGAGGAATPAPGVQELRPIDPPACLRCAEAVAQGMPPTSTCTSDGPPSSSERLATYFDCVCRTKCVEVCSLHCAGTLRDAACAGCVERECAAAVQQCDGGGS